MRDERDDKIAQLQADLAMVKSGIVCRELVLAKQRDYTAIDYWNT